MFTKKLITTHLIAGLMILGGAIWSIAETLMYFIKDNPFNWWSLGLFAAGTIFAIGNFIYAYAKIKNNPWGF